MPEGASETGRFAESPAQENGKEDPLVSIVVNNYNYGRYLRDAVDSALGQTYAHTEVIAVDDGSTDDSREIIASYGERIIAVFKKNGGQASAFNTGFLASKGEIVIFVDADDFLFPSAAETVVSVWRPDLAKVQYRMQLVDSRGENLHKTIPHHKERLMSGDLRGELLQKGVYPGPPTSGNAFARTFLAAILPMPESEYRLCADGYLIILAPLYGAVLSLEEPLAAYRLHGANRWGLSSDSQRLAGYVRHDLQKLELLAARAAGLGYNVPGDLPLRDFATLSRRLLSLRLAPDRHPVKTDRPLRLAYQGIRALWFWSGRSWWKCMALSLWFLLAGVLPPPCVRTLSAWMASPEERPRLLKILASSG